MSIDTATITSTIQTPSNMDDTDWTHFRKLGNIKLTWSPRSITDRFRISPITIRRLLNASESRVANAERHLRYKSSTYKPKPCQYIIGTGRKWRSKGEDKRMKIVEYYDSSKVRDDYKPSPMEVSRGNLGWEDAFYEAVGLGGEHHFKVVDVERPDDVIATMQYEHKTGGAIGFVKKSVAKLTRRKNYGTCLSTISPYRS